MTDPLRRGRVKAAANNGPGPVQEKEKKRGFDNVFQRKRLLENSQRISTRLA